jgi:hypothetical protein
MVAGPALEGETPAGPPQIDPPQCALFLAGGPGTVAGVRSAVDMPTGLFHGGIIQADCKDRLSGYA